MSWNLFLDDERFPALHETGKFVVARSVNHAIDLIVAMGCPSYISFDNDLGEGQLEGYDLAKMMVEMDMDGVIHIPNDFDWYVHSQNCKAIENINAYLRGYLDRR